MRLVCPECKKRYDYNKDEFCPRCGAYNQPPRANSTAGHTVLRKDGVNEVNHKGSFVHKEVHSEKQERRQLRLDQPKGKKPPNFAIPTLAGKSKGTGSSLETILDIGADLLDAFFDSVAN